MSQCLRILEPFSVPQTQDKSTSDSPENQWWRGGGRGTEGHHSVWEPVANCRAGVGGGGGRYRFPASICSRAPSSRDLVLFLAQTTWPLTHPYSRGGKCLQPSQACGGRAWRGEDPRPKDFSSGSLGNLDNPHCPPSHRLCGFRGDDSAAELPLGVGMLAPCRASGMMPLGAPQTLLFFTPLQESLQIQELSLSLSPQLNR